MADDELELEDVDYDGWDLEDEDQPGAPAAEAQLLIISNASAQHHHAVPCCKRESADRTAMGVSGSS